MTPHQIKIGLVALGVIASSVALNLLALQPTEGRGTRPERAYRGLDALPGTTSTSIGKVSEAASPTSVKRDRADAQAEETAPASLTLSIQRALAARGYDSGERDGVIDVVTRAAILDFEETYGLPLTAEPTKPVLDALQRLHEPVKVAASSAVRPGPEAESLIRTVQLLLDRHGYQPGTVDGRMGDATANAIRAFERNQGMASSGRVTAPLMMRLADAARTGRVAAARD